MGLKKKIF